MIHDLSGSPVAVASMVTHFLPSFCTDRVSRSNFGALFILRPGHMGEGGWMPCARLEAWENTTEVMVWAKNLSLWPKTADWLA